MRNSGIKGVYGAYFLILSLTRRAWEQGLKEVIETQYLHDLVLPLLALRF